MTRMAHNGTLVAMVKLDGDKVAEIEKAVLMHQTPAQVVGGQVMAQGKYFQFRLETDVADSLRYKADPATGVVFAPASTYAAFRFIVDGQEVEIGKALPEYEFNPPAKVAEELKPVAKTSAERQAARDAAKKASEAKKAAKAAEKAAKPVSTVSTVKAEHDSKRNPQAKSAHQKAAESGKVSEASALQKRLRAKREADAKAAAEKATAAKEVASEIVALPTTQAEVVAEIEGILA